MEWTDEKVTQLRTLWEEGLSASKIAKILGDFSRNAVIGKVHRLKLSGRTRNPAASTEEKKIDLEKPSSLDSNPKQLKIHSTIKTPKENIIQLKAETKEAEKEKEDCCEEMPPSRKLELVQLTEKTCKWPQGDPLMKDFSFCGNPTESGPYCTYHSKIAFQVISERRRTRSS